LTKRKDIIWLFTRIYSLSYSCNFLFCLSTNYTKAPSGLKQKESPSLLIQQTICERKNHFGRIIVVPSKTTIFIVPIEENVLVGSSIYYSLFIPKHHRVNARNTCTILRHSLRADLFFGHNFCILTPNDSRIIDKVLMTITHLAYFFCNLKK